MNCNYRKSSKALQSAYFTYRKQCPRPGMRVVDFAAGWNAAAKQLEAERSAARALKEALKAHVDAQHADGLPMNCIVGSETLAAAEKAGI